MQYLLISIAVIAGLVVIGLWWLHRHFRAPRIDEKTHPQDYDMPGDAVEISTVKDKRLFGWWIRNSAEASATVVLLHGWGSSSSQLLPLAVPFFEEGYNVLLIDSRNHGRSESHGFSSMPRFAEDLQHSLDWLQENHSESAEQTVLVGHSVGAGAVLLTASRRNDIDAVISISAFSNPLTMMQSYLQKWPIPQWMVSAILNYVQWLIGFRFDEIAPMNSAAKLNCPLLLVHGTSDTTVPITEAHLIHQNCHGKDCTLIEIEGAEHDSVDKIELHGHELVSFLKRDWAV